MKSARVKPYKGLLVFLLAMLGWHGPAYAEPTSVAITCTARDKPALRLHVEALDLVISILIYTPGYQELQKGARVMAIDNNKIGSAAQVTMPDAHGNSPSNPINAIVTFDALDLKAGGVAKGKVQLSPKSNFGIPFNATIGQDGPCDWR